MFWLKFNIVTVILVAETLHCVLCISANCIQAVFRVSELAVCCYSRWRIRTADHCLQLLAQRASGTWV